ncbi:MAG TPA: choice-of-anchor Q domain-containing protein [Candidatus Dormibacteraeota bacterium]|nr:choice-of-anchor Q domain-containing protein [Candidatus Dormibacteraeota bacterium]
MKTLAKLLALALFLISASNAVAEVLYVDVNSTNATPPYTNWPTAAREIQDAVDVALSGDEIVAANGTYSNSRIQADSAVTLDKSVSLRSVNGPQFTRIQAPESARCVTMDNGGANLSGFTLTGGYLLAGFGGGVSGGTLNNCIVTQNRTADSGGGAALCTLNNCTLTGNSAAYGFGGGAYGCTLNNCTLTGNSTQADGGGAAYCTLNNCIVYSNTAPSGPLGSSPDFYQCAQSYCWSADPLFVNRTGGNLRLRSNSPCINAGLNAFPPAGADLDGNPRIVGGTVDIGAYEFQSPVSMICYAWLQEFNLAITALTDNSDPDGDAVDNYHEWLAGTNPTNRFSSPAQLTIIPSGTNVILTWPTNAVGFTLQSTTNLVSPAVWTTNSPAPVVICEQNVVTNPITGAQRFYRLIH